MLHVKRILKLLVRMELAYWLIASGRAEFPSARP